jgi:hypothetical protein
LQASQGGATQVNVYQQPGLSRQIFWARYVDWFFTTPLLLLDLVLLADVSKFTTGSIVVTDALMILVGLFGAVEARSNKWGWFAFGCIFMLYVFYELAWNVRRSAYARGRENGERSGRLCFHVSGPQLVLSSQCELRTSKLKLECVLMLYVICYFAAIVRRSADPRDTQKAEKGACLLTFGQLCAAFDLSAALWLRLSLRSELCISKLGNEVRFDFVRVGCDYVAERMYMCQAKSWAEMGGCVLAPLVTF